MRDKNTPPPPLRTKSQEQEQEQRGGKRRGRRETNIKRKRSQFDEFLDEIALLCCVVFVSPFSQKNSSQMSL